MKISYKWLNQFITLTETPEEIAKKLTYSGLEVEAVELYEPFKGGLEGLLVGKVLECERIPETEKLHKTKVDIGNGEVLAIVCGAPNIKQGLTVVVAPSGATLYPSDGGEPLKIKKGKIRGEVSEGMICAEDEIGLGGSHAGVIELSEEWAAGTAVAKVYKIETDHIFEIGLTPNRADAASHRGVARDLKALYKRALHPEKAISISNSLPVASVSIENKEACPRYTGIVLKNVKVAASPEWLQFRLKSIGLHPINNVVDITNYVLHGWGQPMHAFDFGKVKDGKIIVRNAKKGETLLTLDGITRTLNEADLLICNATEPMCIAGVMGGKDSGVSENTTSIFLESAYFHPTPVRKSSQRHAIKTDSSFRFERGTDPNIPAVALQVAVQLLQEITGAEIASAIFDSAPATVAPFEIKTSYPFITDYIGKEIPAETIRTILTDLEIQVSDTNNGQFTALVPPFKVDVTRPADLVEEVLRIYGYDNIPLSSSLSTNFLAEHPIKDRDKMQKKLTATLAGTGFSEIITNSLTTPVYAALLGKQTTSVEIQNKLSEELGVMRQDLLFSGLEILRYNINRRQQDLRLFEFGFVYKKGEAAGQFIEDHKLGLWVCGASEAESWQKKTQETDFYSIKQALALILDKLNISKYELRPLQNTMPFKEGLELFVQNKSAGMLGLVSPDILAQVDIKIPVYAAELNTAVLLKAYDNLPLYQEVTKFPEVKRDLSLVIDKKITFEELKKIASKVEKKLISDINVFDVFEGKQLGEDKKAYAISITLVDKTQTLTDKVIEQTMERLIEAYEKELGAVIRK
ncbi:MAG: phenylalanyl-tRNA synthetase, beta subunit [Chitinophagaceae bacterium]|nr:phenylalanyl-tRNA synthetase, beta subunit [Chitinophagaceae bacterium]